MDLLSFAASKSLSKNNFKDSKHFTINFSTFSKIFWNKVPATFIDFLFLYGGL